jgi:hypothetical protein
MERTGSRMNEHAAKKSTVPNGGRQLQAGGGEVRICRDPHALADESASAMVGVSRTVGPERHAIQDVAHGPHSPGSGWVMTALVLQLAVGP